MSKFRVILATTIVLATTLFSSGFVAQAVVAPSVTIANSGLTLTGSTIANFDPTATLRLNLSVTEGEITVSLGDSGAVVASGASLKGSTVSIVGTQEQLNAALATTVMSQNCSATRSITASVTPGTDFTVINPANGHLYSLVTSISSSFADARAAAKLKTIPGTTGFGYLANITSAAENTFVNTYFTGTPFIGGSDSVTEGDWYWMDGPEAGTKFYSAGAAVNNAFVTWGTNEPNNSSAAEHYAQLWFGDTWNDIAGSTTSLVEFGGMSGDDFSAFVGSSAASTATLTVPVLLSGAGTSTNPYLVASQSDFAGVAVCSGAGVYFQQTQDIVMSDTFVGQGTMKGHYDGNGKKLDVSAATLLESSIFSDISGTALATDTSVKNLDVIGSQTQDFMGCGNAVFARSINFATIDDVNLTNAKITADCEGGLLARSISNSVVKNSSVTGEIDVMMFLMGAGGLAASANSTQFLNNNCNVTFGLSEEMSFVDMVDSLGACVGRSSSSSYTDVHSTGSINLVEGTMGPIMMMRGLGGLIGESYQDSISDSSSSVSITSSRGYGLGGLLGNSNQSTINRSFATGNISDTDGYGAGGLIGYAAASTVSNTYATGAVTTNQYGGSLVGDMQAGTTVSKSYATGLVTVGQGGSSRGLVGNSDSASLTDSYWKILANGVPSTIESFGQEVPKHSGELKKAATFANWNISATPSSSHDWAICPGANGGYPYLAWQEPAGACARSFTSGATAVMNGLAYVGGSMSVTTVNWDPLATLSYQWFDGVTPIAGANAAYFKPTSAQKGKLLSVKVTGSKDGYVSSEVASAATKVAGAPLTATVVIGGFAAKSGKISAATKAAVAKTLKGAGTVLSVKCDAFATGKKLTAVQKALATTRANAVCALVKATHKSATTRSVTSIFKKTDKIAEGVRVTFTSFK
jgi:hypothetical protein